MAVVDIPDKICPHCGDTKWYSYKDKTRNKIRYQCVIRCREINSTEKAKKRCKIYRHVNKVECQKASRRWALKFPEKRKAIETRHRTKQTASVNTTYIKRLIVGRTSLTFHEIPAELVQIKRKSILLNRQLKQLTT